MCLERVHLFAQLLEACLCDHATLIGHHVLVEDVDEQAVVAMEAVRASLSHTLSVVDGVLLGWLDCAACRCVASCDYAACA